MSPEQLDIKCSSYRDNCKLFVEGVGASAGGIHALFVSQLYLIADSKYLLRIFVIVGPLLF